MKYLFLLGRNSELSKLEIYSYFKTYNIEFNIFSDKNEYLILDCKIKPKEIIEQLGGTVKIFENISLDNFLNIKLPEKFVFKLDVNKEFIRLFKEKIKKEKVKGIEKPKINPSEIHKLKLPYFEFIERENMIFILSAVTNPKKFEEIDKYLPFRDPKIEMSFRLAKILINIAGAKKNKIFLDPFCGTGTLLCMAALKGCNVIGNDIEKNRIKEAEENLKYFIRTENINTNFKFLCYNAKEISKYVAYADIIVTEPYLGPLLKTLPKIDEAKKILKELNDLYSVFFSEASKILREKMIIILPVFKTKEGETIKLNYEKMIIKNKFKIENKIEYSQNNKLKREIYILTPNNFTGTR